MSFTFNVEWLAWIVETLLKVLFHDQEVVVQKDDGTSISQI